MARLRQTCCLGLPSKVLIPRILEDLHEVVPADRFHFAWSDAIGNVVDGYWEKPNAEALDYFMRHHRQFEKDAGFTMRQLLLFGKPTGNVRWPGRPGFEQTESYRVLMKNLGLRYSLDGVLRNEFGPLGAVFAIRRDSEGDFSADDEANLAHAVRYMAHAVTHQAPSVDTFIESGDTALVVFDSTGRPSYQSDRATELCLYALAYVDGAPTWKGGLSLEEGRAALGRLFERVRRSFEDPAQTLSVPAWTLSNRWGEFLVRAYQLRAQGDGATSSSYGVLVEKKTPVELRILQRIKDMPLSNRQREVCFLLARGVAMADITQMLGIAQTTLKEHARAIYRKLGVRNRDELLPLVS